MTLLITGSCGFIGQYLYHTGVLKEFNVIWGTTSNFEKSRDYIKFDSLYSNISDVLKDTRVDVIIHLAAVIPQTFEASSYELFRQNTLMMEHISRFALSKKISKLIYTSTFGSMNSPASYDIKDYYTLSKITGEHFCSILNSKGISTLALRLSSPYGEYNNRNSVIKIFADRALSNKPIEVYGTGSRVQNFIYVGDVAGSILKCIQVQDFGVYSVVNNQNTTMLELATRIVEQASSTSEIIVGQNPEPNAESLVEYQQSRSVEVLGYNLQYTIEKGLSNYLHWRKKNNK
jgi:nucleoside-diphosphate-sugar epimerase